MFHPLKLKSGFFDKIGAELLTVVPAITMWSLSQK